MKPARQVGFNRSAQSPADRLGRAGGPDLVMSSASLDTAAARLYTDMQQFIDKFAGLQMPGIDN